MKFITLTLHDDNAKIGLSPDKIMAFLRPAGKAWTEVIMQNSLCFKVAETPVDIATLCSMWEP